LSFFVIIIIKIKIDAPRAITPPNFEGMERRITYANKKYHSGWMWTGATRGLAGLKFSTSPRMFGMLDERKIINVEIKIIGIKSLAEKSELNFTLSVLVFVVEGVEDPFSCNSTRWIKTKIAISIGRIKWREKNRFKVGWETEGPPQIHVRRSFPTNGIADSTPVITVAPQKDICPHGNTYPRNAVAISINKMITPDSQTFFCFDGEAK